ncbi:hypothetical protein D1007_10251 [Hordeum vulgare]|nr:hypothetical protein D1007_10251 [Hordeum vulgare]
MQGDDVPLQLLKDEHKKKKLEAFERNKAARLQKGSNVSESGDLEQPTFVRVSGTKGDVVRGCDNLVVRVKMKFKRTVMKKHLLGEVTPRRSPHVSKVAGPRVGELAKISGQATGVTPCHSPRVLDYAKTSSPLGSSLSGKGIRCGVKLKGGSTKYVLQKKPMRSKRGANAIEGATEGEDDAKCFNKTVRCSVKEVKVCANLLQPRHKDRVIKSGFGCVFDSKIDSNISPPLMGHIDTKIDPSTTILDMGELNKKLCITSGAIHHLFGFPQGVNLSPELNPPMMFTLVLPMKYLESMVYLRTSFGLFEKLHDACLNPFEDEPGVVISKIERPDSVDLGHDGGNEDRAGEGKLTRDDTMINASSTEKDSIKPSVEPGSTQAIRVKPLAIELSVVVGDDSPTRAIAPQPIIFVLSHSRGATVVIEDDNTMHTRDDDDLEIETDSFRKEEDLPSSATALGKNA